MADGVARDLGRVKRRNLKNKNNLIYASRGLVGGEHNPPPHLLLLPPALLQQTRSSVQIDGPKSATTMEMFS